MRREFTLTASDGTALFARAFEAEAPRAVLCVSHGLGEHGERYRKMADFMNAHGVSVYVHDQRGHGRSIEKKSRRGLARMKELEGDLLTLLEYAGTETGLPVFLFGHSLGGLIGLYTTLHDQPDVSGVIITSPWLQLVNSPPQFAFRALGALGGVLTPFSIANGIAASSLCHDSVVCAAYEADPLNHDRIGLALAADANRAANWVLMHPQELRRPLLLCHGEQDPICSVEGSRRFSAQAPGVRYVEFPNEYHELHNEPTAAPALFEEEITFLEGLL